MKILETLLIVSLTGFAFSLIVLGGLFYPNTLAFKVSAFVFGLN